VSAALGTENLGKLREQGTRRYCAARAVKRNSRI